MKKGYDNTQFGYTKPFYFCLSERGQEIWKALAGPDCAKIDPFELLENTEEVAILMTLTDSQIKERE